MLLPFLFLHNLTLCLAASSRQAFDPSIEYNEAIDNGTYGYYPAYTFATEPEITSPKTNWLQWDPACDDGLLYFVTPRGWGLERPGPSILDWKGELVWFEHFANEFGGQAYDFMVQTYLGEEFLTFWTGDDRVRGHGSGTYFMLNSSYDVVHEVNAAGELAADLHEFLITPEGTALMTMYQPYQFDVTSFREFDVRENPKDEDPNWIWDCLFQEIDIATNELLFQWRASDHIDLNDTYHNVWGTGNRDDPFDWYHLNSITKDEAGNYLLSARYTHSITYVSGTTGDVLWTLGGKNNNFMDLGDGSAINFAWQHDARFVDLNAFPESYTPPREQKGIETCLVTLFDNAAEDQNYEYGLEYSRGLLLELTYPTPSPGRQAPAPGTDLRHKPSQTREDDEDLDINELKVELINGTSPSHTVRVIQSFIPPEGVRSSSQGSMQILPQESGFDPLIFVGYGLNAVFTTFASDGTPLCNAHYGATTSWERGDIQSYRAYKFPWIGRPRWSPKIGVSDDDVDVFASWNGATEVAEWVLEASAENDGDWEEVARQDKDGFEAFFELADSGTGTLRFLRIVALDVEGEVLPHGISAVLDRGYTASFFPDVVAQQIPERLSQASFQKVFWCVVAIVAGCYIAYEAYRRYLGWKQGQPAIGAWRWRGNGYHLLSDVTV
nr:hypothetical protein B0A51_16024 [Rachicladosporium sp. CCFEE 5018]